MSKFAIESAQPTTSFVDMANGSYRTFTPNGLEIPILSGHSSLGVAAVVLPAPARRVASPLVVKFCICFMTWVTRCYVLCLICILLRFLRSC